MGATSDSCATSLTWLSPVPEFARKAEAQPPQDTPGQGLFHDTELTAVQWSAQVIPAREGLHVCMTYAPLLFSAGSNSVHTALLHQTDLSTYVTSFLLL